MLRTRDHVHVADAPAKRAGLPLPPPLAVLAVHAFLLAVIVPKVPNQPRLLVADAPIRALERINAGLPPASIRKVQELKSNSITSNRIKPNNQENISLSSPPNLLLPAVEH